MDMYALLRQRIVEKANNVPKESEVVKKAKEAKRIRKNEYNKRYDAEHPERRREYNKKYRHEHKELIKELARKYTEKHHDQILAYRKQYNDAHKDNIKRLNKEYYEAHKLEIRTRVKEYQAKKLAEDPVAFRAKAVKRQQRYRQRKKEMKAKEAA